MLLTGCISGFGNRYCLISISSVGAIKRKKAGSIKQDGNAVDTKNESSNQGGKNSGTVAQLQNKTAMGLDTEALLRNYHVIRGTITASKAAALLKEKINAENNFNGVILKNAEIIAYNDEKGSFTIEVGMNKSGTSSLRQFTFTNFDHPFKDTYLKSVIE